MPSRRHPAENMFTSKKKQTTLLVLPDNPLMWKHHPGVIVSTYAQSGLSCIALPYEEDGSPFEWFDVNQKDARRTVIMNVPQQMISFVSLYIIKAELYTKMILPDKKDTVDVYKFLEVKSSRENCLNGPFLLKGYLNVIELLALLDKKHEFEIVKKLMSTNNVSKETIAACYPFRSESEMAAFLDWIPVDAVCTWLNCKEDVCKMALRHLLTRAVESDETSDSCFEERCASDSVEMDLFEILEEKMTRVEFWNVDDLCLGEAATAIGIQLCLHAKSLLRCHKVCILYPYGFSDTSKEICKIANRHDFLDVFASHEDMDDADIYLILNCFGDYENTVDLLQILERHTNHLEKCEGIFVGGRHIPIPCSLGGKRPEVDTWLEHDFISSVLSCANAIKRGYPDGVGFPGVSTFEKEEVRECVCRKLREDCRWNVTNLTSHDGCSRFVHTKRPIALSSVPDGVWMSKDLYPSVVTDFEYRSKKDDTVILCNGDTAHACDIIYNAESGKRQIVVECASGSYERFAASACPSLQCTTPHFCAYHASVFFKKVK